MSTYLGLDVGGTNIRLAVWDEREPLLVARADTPTHYEAFLKTVAELVAPYSAAGVGVGFPGVAFDQRVGWVPNVPFLAGEDVAAGLSSACGAPVFFSNDAHAALLGEARFGAARNAKVALLISLGTGVGGAALIDGRVFRGASGSAGSFGWVNMSLDDPTHPDHGQLELQASGSALAEAAGEMGLDPHSLVAAARGGDEKALDVVLAMGRRIGVGLATLVSVFDPEVVLVSGGLSAEFDLVEGVVNEALQLRASPSGRRVPIRLAKLGWQAGAVGAAVLGREGRAAFV